jgi:APA family basic amino acid/polyamine antiporter
MDKDSAVRDLKAARPENAPGSLPRILGFWDVVGIVIGGVIGSGIFIVPAAVAAGVQYPLLILAVWVVGGILCFFGALTFAELGTAFPGAGGMYIYLREAYGPLIAFLFGWTLFLVIDSGSIATLAVAFSTKYLPYFLPVNPWMSKVIAVAFVAFLASVNYLGAKWGAYLQILLTVIKFGAILAVCVIVLGFAKGNTENFVTPAPPAFSWDLLTRMGIALVATFWAYKGWEMTTFSVGELKNPARNLPSGLFISMGSVIFLYILANIAYLYAFPASAIAKSSRIASDAMDMAVGPVGGAIIALTILFSMTGAANANMLCSTRVFFAMAADGLFFKRIADVHPRFLTPHVSIVALGFWAVVLSLSGTFEQLFNYVVFGQWIFFGLTAAAVIILRKKRPNISRPYKTWGYPITPLIFIFSAFLISVNSLINQFWNSFAGLAIILLGVPAFLYWRRKRDRESVTGSI